MGTSLMKDGELVVAYNMLATKLGKPTVKKFPDNETAMRRYMELKKMTDTTTTAPTTADAIKIAKAARAKATGKKAPAKAAKKATGKKAATKKAATKKAAGSGDGRGRTSMLSGKKLHPSSEVKKDGNPHREGTTGAKGIDIVMKNPGITYEEAVKKGAHAGYLRHDFQQGFIDAR